MGYMWKDAKLNEDTKVHCDNCNWYGTADMLDEISDFGERISAGETVPAGQCPECGACAHLRTMEEEGVV